MWNKTSSYFEQKSKESRECNCPNAKPPVAIGPFWQKHSRHFRQVKNYRVNQGPARLIKKPTRVAKQIDSPFGPLTFITPQQREKQRKVRKTGKSSPLTQR